VRERTRHDSLAREGFVQAFSPGERQSKLLEGVKDLVTEGSLTKDPGDTLVAKLEQAIKGPGYG
jgi:hypothetical protein